MFGRSRPAQPGRRREIFRASADYTLDAAESPALRVAGLRAYGKGRKPDISEDAQGARSSGSASSRLSMSASIRR